MVHSNLEVMPITDPLLGPWENEWWSIAVMLNITSVAPGGSHGCEEHDGNVLGLWRGENDIENSQGRSIN
jgi:hypothetical protein